MLFFQETKAVLNPKSLARFVEEKLPLLGTSACPPYHLAFVIGGTSAEACMKTLSSLTTRYLDTLPTTGSALGRAFRDLEWEAKILEIARKTGIGAQFGGKYFALDVRVIRLPRHGARCPVGMGVSCSADRNIKAKITEEGLFLDKLENNPGRLIPSPPNVRSKKPGWFGLIWIPADAGDPGRADQIAGHNPGIADRTACCRSGQRSCKAQGAGRFRPWAPQVFQAVSGLLRRTGKTPTGYASGSFGPTTAGRMDSYVEQFQSLGGSLVMLAKGNRSAQVTAACKKNGGFYLGSIGGPAAILAKENISKVELLEYPELGMEAVWKIEVRDFPAFVLVDDKGNDFFANGCSACLPGK